MTVATEKRRRRRKRLDFAAVVCLGFLLVLSQLCSPSSAEVTAAASGFRWSPARKARAFGQGHAGVLPVSVSISGSSPESTVTNARNRTKGSSSTDKINYDEEKRLVHTGPNPLHN